VFLKDQAKHIPDKPGVYFFKSKSNKILYIGKAKKLKARIKSYFSKNNTDTKSKVMISKSSDLDYLVTNNEVEAIITEANMIKEYRPKYNIVLKDDKTFPYIVIRKELYPKVQIVRKKNLYKDEHTYFGPYSDVKYLREVIKVLHQVLPLKTCKASVDEDFIEKNRRFKGRTCFCGFCMTNKIISSKDYATIISSIVDFLKGKNRSIRNQIKELMIKASKELRFEEAARYRDNLNIINLFSKRQKRMIKGFSDYDIIHTSTKGKYGLGLVMRVRNGLLIGREKFKFTAFEDNFEKILSGFLTQYYNATLDIPKELVIDTPLSSREAVQKWLQLKRVKKVSIIFPKIGEKRKMLDLCIKNTEMALRNILIKKIRRGDYSSKSLKELKNVLSMKVLPTRIEAFDNSNLQGTSSVAGMVCFIDGRPAKKEFRKFHIKTVVGIDDFESMREVIFRRYSRFKDAKKPLPDLILVDGGKGQLSAAKSSLDKLGLHDIVVIGLAKKLEEVFVPESSEPQNINKSSPALYLLRKIRDEAHRYALAFHKQKRNKKFFNSSLRKIPGLGDKRHLKLFNVYKTTKNIFLQSPDKINLETGIPISICYKIIEGLKAK